MPQLDIFTFFFQIKAFSFFFIIKFFIILTFILSLLFLFKFEKKKKRINNFSNSVNRKIIDFFFLTKSICGIKFLKKYKI